MSSSRSPWGSASESDEERSPPSPASRASSPSVSEDAVEDEAHADEAAASSLRAEAAKFLWGDPEGEEAEEDEDDLLDAEDYIQASSSSAAKMTAAQPGLAADGEEGSFDEEVPYAARVLLKDAEARSRKEKLLLAALNSLTHTEVLLANAPADAAGHLSRVCTSQAGEAGAPPPAAPRLSDGGRQGRPSVSLSSRLSWESEQGGEKRRLSSKRPSFSPDATVSSAASAFPSVSAFPSASSQTLERELGRRPPVSAAERPAVARTSSQSSFRASLSTRRPSLSGEEKSTPQVVGAGQLAPKMMKVMREIFGKRKPVGRFGVYGQPSRRDAESPSSACSASPSHARASPSSLPGSSASFPPPTSSSCPVSGVEAQVPRPDSAASVATESSRKQVSVTVTEEAVRQLKDVNLLLKREGCASSLRRQRAQELYDFEDGHMLYQHPRFCAAAIFRENLVARRLAPLWTAVAARYDAVEGSDDAQQIENQQHLLVQLLRCLAFLAGAPPVDWIQYWMKFAPWLDDAKRVDDSRKKEKKRIEELRARRRRLGLHPSEVEKEAEENFFRDEALHQDPPVQEERRLRSHIVMKYYRGMQTTKKALCCPALWQLLSSVFVDKQDFVDRGGRTAEQQRRLDRLVEAREALYTREKEMKRQLLELEEESKKDFDEEDHLPKHRLRRESVGSKKEQEEEMRALKRELESLREEIFEITETLHDLNRSNREELEKAEGLLENLRLLVCAVLLMPPSLPKSVAVTPGTQLSLVVTMLQQRKEKALALSPLHPGGSSLLHLLLRDTHFDLFGRMQKAFSLVELASASNPQEQDFYDVEKMTGGLGRWAVTHVHAELMERIWTVLRTVHGVVSAVPPLAFAELIAEITAGVPLRSSVSSRASASGGSGAPSRRRGVPVDLQQVSHEHIKFLSRLDPLKARQVLLAERVVAAEQRNRKGAQVRVFHDQRRFVDYERLFLFRSLALRPFDLEEPCADAQHEAETPERGRGDAAETAERGQSVSAASASVGEKERRKREGEARCGGVAGSAFASASKAAWLRTALSREDLCALQKLIAGFLGIDEQFTAPVNPETLENDMYCGRFYSLAFLLEAAIKELLREVDADYHWPWDAELVLDLISWIFAYQVTYFKAVNRLRIAHARSRAGAAAPAPLDRIDMIFCLQGYETALVQDFLVGLLHRAVFVLSLSRGARPLLLSCLQCLRQLLRLLQVHVNSKKTEIVEAVKTQLASWIKRGVVGTLAHVMKTFKHSSFEPDVFLYALEIALVFASLLQAVGGQCEVPGLPRRGLGMQRRGGRRPAGLLMDDDEGLDGLADSNAPDLSAPTGSRVVTVDDVVKEFLKGEIILQAMQMLSHYSTNAVAVNSALISFFELILSYKGGQAENAAFFFDLSYFLIFRNMLNDVEARTDPRVSWVLAFAETVVERFFFLWGGDSRPGEETESSDPYSGSPQDRNEDGEREARTGEKRQDDEVGGSADALPPGAARTGEEAEEGNAFLPLELLFSKKKSGRTGFGDSVAGDVFCSTSEGSFASVFSNYRSGSDALLLAAMDEQLKTQGFVAPLDAAAECRRNLQDDLGFSGRESANKFDKHEDELLIREFLTYRDINNWDQYIATTLGKTARAVRKRLQQLRLSNPDVFPPDFAPDDDVFLSSRRTSVDAFAAAEPPAAAGVPPLLGAVQALWAEFSALSDGGDTLPFSRFLQSLAENFADACRLREVLRMDAVETGQEAAAAFWEAVAVEEPLEGGEASVALLDSAAFRRLMQVMGAERKAESKDNEVEEGTWKIPADHPQEILRAAVEKLKELVGLEQQELDALAAQHMHRERQRDEIRANRVKRRPFVFNSAALAEALLNYRFLLQRLEREPPGPEGEGGDLFSEPREEQETDRTRAASDSVSAVFQRQPAAAILHDILEAFKSLSAKLMQRREEDMGETEDKEMKENDALELNVEEFPWFACEAIGEAKELRKTLAVMGCFRDFPGGREDEGSAQIRWQVPLDVDAEVFGDRVDAFANFASKDLDELEMLVQGVRGDRVDRSRGDEEEQTWEDGDSQDVSRAKHKREGGRSRHSKKKDRSPSRRKKKEKSHQSRPLLLTLQKLTNAASSGSGLLPEKPTTRHRYLLASKLFLWREFLESDEVNRELLHGDRPLQRLLACLREWNAERVAVVERAAEEAEDSDEEESVIRRLQPPHLVLTAHGGQEEEVAFSASSARAGEGEGKVKEGEEGEGERRRAPVEETEEGGVRFRVVRGVLPNVAAGLWVCAALGGKPVESSENREFLWRAEERYLPSSWLRKQLRILELVLLNPQMQTAAGVQVELGLIREVMEREEEAMREKEAQREEEMEEEENLDDEETGEDRGQNEGAEAKIREQDSRKERSPTRGEEADGDMADVSSRSMSPRDKTSKERDENMQEEDDFDLVPEPEDSAEASLSPKKDPENNVSDVDEDYEMFLEPSDGALSDDALFDAWDVVGSEDEEENATGPRRSDGNLAGADLLACLIDDLEAFPVKRGTSETPRDRETRRPKKRSRDSGATGGPPAPEGTADAADACEKENAAPERGAERNARTDQDVDRVKKIMRSLDTAFAELEQVRTRGRGRFNTQVEQTRELTEKRNTRNSSCVSSCKSCRVKASHSCVRSLADPEKICRGLHG
ncbi:hypothetical protein TGVEG_275430 [Toxoplasma gondii VEG]|uniref:Uncharacterized protein n=1 Tax=Toxoplasma gondii (strain ATCC 50861 / VEG) TaxID=432359 RepID=V4ZFW7_TOXGV|nr:hypothetical protein TGVEG_275430 [Toxoplasma gondii VEG]